MIAKNNLKNLPSLSKGVSFMQNDNNWHYRVPNFINISKRIKIIMRNEFAKTLTELAEQ